jgi:hypothetical protein
MPTNKEIDAKVDELQTALDSEQQAVKDLLDEKQATNDALQANIVTLNETITTLQAQVADGGTEEERAAVIAKLTTLKEDLESTVAP